MSPIQEYHDCNITSVTFEIPTYTKKRVSKQERDRDKIIAKLLQPMDNDFIKTFEEFNPPIIKKDEIEMEKRNPFSDSYSPNKESMKGSTMFWWALGVSFYLYGGYLAIINNIFKETTLYKITEDSLFNGVVIGIWIIESLALVVVILWYSYDVIKIINKLLDKILK